MLFGPIITISKKKGFSLAASQFLAVALFGVVYWIMNHLERQHKVKDEKGKDPAPLGLFDAVFFSLVTQTTVGYGTVVPTTFPSKVVNFVQLLTIYGILAVHL